METGLIKTEEIQSIVAKATDVLTDNQRSAEKAEQVGHTLLDTIEASGMNDELDKVCNDYQVKVKKTIELMNDRRKPITQLFDEVKKRFTTEETKCSKIYSLIQDKRNVYATQKAEDIKLKQQEIQRKIAIEKENSVLFAEGTSALKIGFAKQIEDSKRGLMKLFESLTTNSYTETLNKIKNFEDTYSGSLFMDITVSLSSVILSSTEVKNIMNNIFSNENFESFKKQFSSEIGPFKQKAIDKLPSKLEELKAIASANEEDRDKLQAASKKRQAEEAERIAKETADAQKKAISDSEAKKQAEIANTLFDGQIQMPIATGSHARESYEINVINQVGYLVLVSFYFEKEGKSENLDKLEKKTLGSIKKFAEAYAQKHGEKIQSPYLIYKDAYKAIAKK